jgi:predicted MPP superfamily phosphohydrolase
MKMKILAFSDLHGNALTLKRLRDSVKEESFDYILVAGDLTNADLISPDERVHQVKEIFSIMESFNVPYYYVWGLPDREECLALAEENYEVTEHEGVVTLRKGLFNLVLALNMTKDEYLLFKEIEDFLSSLTFGKHLKEGEMVKIGNYWLTSSPMCVNENTILLRHNYRKILSKALLQLDGHLHFGQYVRNYLNLDFLYRDGFHNAPSMIGCYWKLTLEGPHLSVEFKDIDHKLKLLNCPNHPEEGTFYIPQYWYECPVCRNPENALVARIAKM